MSSKLVRDKVVEIMWLEGKAPRFHTATREELCARLFDKLLEEVGELMAADTQEGQIEELVDVLEVVFALALEAHGVFGKDLMQRRHIKYLEKGSFKRGIVLDEL